jgi:hypothetical protein
MATDSIDYDGLMQANLTEVFGNRNVIQRVRAIKRLYAEDAMLYEPDAAVQGHAAIDAAVSRLLGRLPADFVFSAVGPAVGHHGMGRLSWRLGPVAGPAAVTGMDLVHVSDGRIQSLFVFLDPAAP